MKTLTLMLLCCFTTMFYFVHAQSTTVKLLDLSVYPAIELDTISGIPLDTNTFSFNIDFKVNNVSNAASLRILVGTIQNSGDILNSTSGIIFQNG